MILAYLIFAHLLGDFIFQPSKLVLWKIKSKRGTLVHVFIHFLVSSLVLSPFIIYGHTWLLALNLGLAFVHFWIDEAKISYDLHHDEKLLPFLVDQFLHLLSILLAYFAIDHINFQLPGSRFSLIYQDIRILGFLNLLILFSTFAEVYRYQKEREHNKKAKFHPNSDRMLTRILALSITFAAFMLISLYAS